MDKKNFDLQIGAFLPARIRGLFNSLDNVIYNSLSEIRLCIGASVVIEYSGKRKFISKDGISDKPENGYVVAEEDIARCMELLTKSSSYAYNRYINEGFLTIPGGHRVGLVGNCIMENDKIISIGNINSLNFRIAYSVCGVADLVFEDIYNGQINNTLIISPPGCGKTTMLKDIIRLFLDIRATGKIIKCVVIDERSELVGRNSNGTPLSKGTCTPAIYGCPKSIAIPMTVRSMSPDVIVADELASENDISAARYAAASGCSIVASTHGSDEYNNAIVLMNSIKIFRKVIVLSCRHGPGTIEKILDGESYG